jgi:hypothetical protein
MQDYYVLWKCLFIRKREWDWFIEGVKMDSITKHLWNKQGIERICYLLLAMMMRVESLEDILVCVFKKQLDYKKRRWCFRKTIIVMCILWHSTRSSLLEKGRSQLEVMKSLSFHMAMI